MNICDTKIAISNVILATDFSAESAQAADCARELREDYNARVHIVHVMDLFPFTLQDDDQASARIEQIRHFAEERMREFTRRHYLEGKNFNTCLLSGEPSFAIEQFTREHGADLIVLGSRGDTGLRRLFEGSISEEIFRGALCPVMTVGPRAKTHAKMFDHLFFATDLSRISRAALPYTEFLLSANTAARVILGHFRKAEEADVFARHQERRQLERELADMLGPEFRPQIADVAVESCPPADGMLQMVEGCAADLLVLGVRSGGSFTRAATHVPYAVAPRVISEATCPVLTVRAE